MNDLWQFIKECVQLFGWVFFQPDTFRQKLQTIDPDLKPNSNPFLLKDRFAENPTLKRYASQVYWLTIATPIVFTLVFGLITSLAYQFSFHFLGSALFYIGWFMGVSLATRAPRKLSDRVSNFFSVAATLYLSLYFLFGTGPKFLPNLFRPLSGVIASFNNPNRSIKFMIVFLQCHSYLDFYLEMSAEPKLESDLEL